jgi:hypothetical protein
MSPNSTHLEEAAVSTDAGWRPDPTGRYEWRYWDSGWTNRVASSRSGPPTAPDTSAAAPVAPAAPEPRVAAPATALPVARAATPAAVPPAQFRAPALEPASPASPATAPAAPGTEPASAPLPVRAWRALTGFFASFANEAESYHSERAVDIDPDPRGERMIVGNPANYGRAGIVALAACGVTIGSFLPWLSGTIDGTPFQRTGFEEGHGWSFTIASMALVCAALLAVRLRPLRWAAMGIALVLAGLTFRDLVHYHDIVTTMNASYANAVDLGTGMWIMAGCAIVALVASFRLGERD